MNTDTTLHPEQFSEEDRKRLRESIKKLQASGEELTEAALRIGDQIEVPLPESAVETVAQALDDLAKGHAVSLISSERGLTTSQAAKMLDVSRPHLVKLLEEGEIPFYKVGSHRRIKANDLQAYKRRREAEAEEAVSELTRQAQELNMGYEEPSAPEE